MPSRIQVRRKKGFRLPPDTVYVGRPTKWGNPFRPGAAVTAKKAVAKYRAYLMDSGDLLFALSELRGRNLACWCKPNEPCHADVLLELANRGTRPPSARRPKPAQGD